MAALMSFGEPSQAGGRQQNLRTCGTTSTLPSPKKSLRRTARSTSMPTIPSRMEVTLFDGDREHKGFGSQSLRFDSVQGEDMPGPGRYGQSKSVIEERGGSVSWGIRGTGGFASKSTRFGARSNPQMPRPGRGVPGPGKYEDVAAAKCTKDSKSFCKAKYSSAFADAETKSRITEVPSMPGPGQYATSKVVADAKECAAAQAAFKSTSTRGVDTKASSAMPGPGEYYDGVPRAISTQFDSNAGSAFKHPSQPKIARIHRDLPPADAKQREVFASYADDVCRACAGPGSSNGPSAMPGPGHYDQNRDRIFESGLASVAGNSAFLPGSKRTDFSHQDLAYIPGPGRYNPRSMGSLNLATAAASFNSASERIKQSAGDAPGPAYYAPSLPKEKMSFRMRSAARQWLS